MARPTRLTVVADTGPIYALIDASDGWHARVKRGGTRDLRRRAAVTIRGGDLSPDANRTRRRGNVRAIADDEFTIEPLDDEDLRTSPTSCTHRDLPLGFVDASVVAIAERLEAREI